MLRLSVRDEKNAAGIISILRTRRAGERGDTTRRAIIEKTVRIRDLRYKIDSIYKVSLSLSLFFLSLVYRNSTNKWKSIYRYVRRRREAKDIKVVEIYYRRPIPPSVLSHFRDFLGPHQSTSAISLRISGHQKNVAPPEISFAETRPPGRSVD